MDQVQRRTLIGLALAAGGAGVVGCSGEQDPGLKPADPGVGNLRQAGVDVPIPRQRYLALRMVDLGGSDPQSVLAALGEAIIARGGVDGLTVTVGVSPSIVVDARGADAIGAAELPVFSTDAIENDARDGDLLLQVCADRRPTVEAAADELMAGIQGASLRWGMDGYRGEVDGRGARNILGFYDGVAVPTTPADLDENVWTDEDDGMADVTICVVRRIRLAHREFGRQAVHRQEEIFGRAKKSGAPLSGGDIRTDVNLQAKSEDGVYDVALDAHARRAHPFTSGAEKLMLRRSYSYRNGSDQGLAFVCFQRTLDMFTKTQASLEEGDALLTFATTTGTGTWLILPGYTNENPLGAALFT